MKSPGPRLLAPAASSSSTAELHLSWSTASRSRNKNSALAGVAAATLNDSAILFGGCSHHRCSGELLRFDGARWSEALATAYGHASHPGPRSGALLVAAGRFAWLVGGVREDENSERPATLDAFQLDMEPSPWVWLRPTTAGEVPPSVDVTSGALIGDAVVTVGGCGPRGCHANVHALSTRIVHGRHVWSRPHLRSVAAPSARGGHCVAHLETLGATLVLGGCDRKRCFHDGWLLRVWTKRAPREVRNGVIVATADDEHEVAWEPLLAGGAAHAPSATQRHSCVVHPRLEWLFVFGGCALDGKCSNALHILRTDSGPAGRAGLLAAAPHWAKIEAVGTPPAPRGAHVALALPLGAEHSDGAIMLLGGANGEHWYADEPLLDLKMRCAAGCAPPSGHCRNWQCECAAGFTGADCATDTRCTGGCSGHGHCVHAACVCDAGWRGDDCATDARCGEACLAHGHCIQLRGEAKCVCEDGFEGSACEVDTRCPRRCSGRGDCVDGVCRCHGGFGGEACGDDERCEARCHDHGECLAAEGSARGRCVCGAGFGGAACELDLRCRPACAHGVCRDGACACEEGYGGGACEAAVCAGGCGHGGRCVAPGRCECEDGWAEAPAAALQPRGLPSTRRRRKPPPAWSKLVEGGRAQCDVAQCSAVGCDARSGACVAPDECMCVAGFGGIDCATRIAKRADLWRIILTGGRRPETIDALAAALVSPHSSAPLRRHVGVAMGKSWSVGWARNASHLWRADARAAGWLAWKPLPERWWVRAAGWTPLHFAVASEWEELAALLLRAGATADDGAVAAAEDAKDNAEYLSTSAKRASTAWMGREAAARTAVAAKLHGLLVPPRARRPHLVRASDHEVEVEWEVPPTAAEYEVTVQQLGQPRWLWPRVSRLEVELEWLVMVAADPTHYTNATRAEAAAHGGKGGGLVPTGTRWADGRLLASYVLGGLSMDKSFMLRLRARNNASGWGAATDAVMVSTSARGRHVATALLAAFGVVLLVLLGMAAATAHGGRAARWRMRGGDAEEAEYHRVPGEEAPVSATIGIGGSKQI